MATQVTLQYQVDVVGASATQIALLMDADAVPVPQDILQAAGLRVISDTTPIATPVVRTIVLGFDPSVAPTVSTTIEEGSVASITRLMAGMDLVSPPPVAFTDEGNSVLSQPAAQTFLEVSGVTIVNNGDSYSAQSFAVVLGQMVKPAQIQRPYPGTLNANRHPTGDIPPSVVQALSIGIQGRGYTDKARILIDGPLDQNDPNSRQAKAIITGIGPHGEILSVQITDPGHGYIRVPKIKVQDDIPHGIEIVRKPDAIKGKVVTAPNIIAPNAATANISPIMGVGTAAKVNITIGLGLVTGATVPLGGNGDLYIGMPQIVVVDPTGAGSGALLVPRMTMSPTIQVTNPGKGLSPATTATLASFFKTLFPDAGDQRAPFWKLMEPAISKSTLSPVKSFPPVLA
jgi:hypothetical protein